MSLYFVKTPNLIQKIYDDLVWSFSSSKKEIYLTFDDGPTPEITEWTLKTLKQFNAKATFFCIGENVKNHPHIFKQVINEGHAIGNHTHNHLNGWKSGNATYFKNIDDAEKIIKSLIPNYKLQTNKLFRPPYGKIKRKQAKHLINQGYKIIMWDVLSADFDQSISVEKCLKNVLKNTTKGSIIIFHDSVKAEKNIKHALPKVLAYFTKKGFKFKVIN